MEARLEFCGNYLEIRNFQHHIEDERGGNPYNCLFDIKVKSGMFSGVADGCEYDYKELQLFIRALEDLISFKIKEISFIEIGFGNKIDFICDRTGHIKVSGEIRGGFAGDHHLIFGFETDQTVFPPFIKALKSL